MSKNYWKNVILSCVGMFLLYASLCISAEWQSLYFHGFNEHNEWGTTDEVRRPKALEVLQSRYGIQIINDKSIIPYFNDVDLYTQNSVTSILEILQTSAEVKAKGRKNPLIIGFSNGGGTLINSLRRLVEYAGVKITSKSSPLLENKKKSAGNIMAFVNKGCIILDAPLLHIKRFHMMQSISSVITPIFGGCAAGLCAFSLFSLSLPYTVTAVVVGSQLLKKPAKKICDSFLTLFARFNPWTPIRQFNPFYCSPFSSASVLKNKITCPFIIHFKEKDGILAVPDAEAADFCSNIGDRNVLIVITAEDNHVESSVGFIALCEKMYAYMQDSGDRRAFRDYLKKEFAENLTMKLYTPQEMKKKYPHSWF